MRMLHVLESFAPGGIETTFLNMLKAFRRHGDDEHHVLAFAGGALEDAYRAVADHVTVGSDTATLDGALSSPHDVAYILFERCAYRLLPQLLATAPTPVVYGKGYDMGGMYRLNEGLRWHADESMLTACDATTFTTSQLAAGYDMTGGRATVLKKAADVARFASVPDPDAATPNRVVCVANLHPRKRIGDLIRAIDVVRNDVPDVELRLVGGGTAAEVTLLKARAADAGVAECVSFAGVIADVAPEIAAARVAALPSSCEGVPTALLEAMAAGRPVVATNVGHVSSIVDPGVEGFLVGVGDVDALAARITELLTNPLKAADMGRAARTRAMSHDVGAIAGTLLATLRDAARPQLSHA
jgi:glycosyltransferase involved in cell wall biosynthesis